MSDPQKPADEGTEPADDEQLIADGSEMAPETEPPTDHEAAPETTTEPDAVSEPEVEPEAEPEPEPESEPQVEPEPEAVVPQPSPGKKGATSAKGEEASIHAHTDAELPFIDDRVSKIWVLLIVGVFAAILAYGLLFGQAGMLTPRSPEPTVTAVPSATPSATVTTTPSATAAPSSSPAPSASPAASATPSSAPASPSAEPSAT